MPNEFSEPRTMARVAYITDDRQVAFLQLPNGLTATYTSPKQIEDIKRNDVVLIDSQGGVEVAPQELWPEESWIGIVRLLLQDEVIVEKNGILKKEPLPTGIKLEEGYTVEGLPSQGITRVVAERPIRTLEITTGDSVAIDEFKWKPDVDLDFDHFGGYSKIVERAKELIELPLEKHRELERIGARPIKGVLLTGPPGTGKTLLSRIIACRAGAVFYEISGPQILSKWLGQSEELIRKIFEDAASQEKAIVFFDEIDSLAGQRSDASHEASRRIVGQLLTAMDGFKTGTNVIVLATTNRPDDIDVALMRPGRFDWEINFPLPTHLDREQILATSARYLSVGPNLQHDRIAQLTDSWSPAELAAIWSEAALLAVQDGRDKILMEDYIGGYERVAVQRGISAASKKAAAKRSE